MGQDSGKEGAGGASHCRLKSVWGKQLIKNNKVHVGSGRHTVAFVARLSPRPFSLDTTRVNLYRRPTQGGMLA